ncbi:MAG: TPM domain-containing protein [Dokdonella sp.]
MPLTARFFLTLTFVAGCVIAVAAIPAEGDPQAIPALTAHVTDLTGTLDATQKQTLEDQLTALEKSKGSQVGVLLLPTTNPEDIAAYGIRVADAWKLGRKGTDDGVIVIVAKNDHRVRIEVGQGLEGAIPDAAAARIIREYITPRFRANDYFGGLQDATGALGKLINDEPLPPPLTDEPAGGGHGDSGDYGPAFILGWFVALTLRRMLGGIPVVPRTGLVGIGAGLAAWFVSGFIPISIGIGVLGMLFGVLGGGKGGGFASGGGWGGFSGGGGGGWSSGGGGGGFSGGGGGFSGGGASGSW